MSSPEVDWTLSEIKTNWSAGSYADIPLERVDRDDSELLDGSVRSHTEDLQSSNFVGASLADTAREPEGSGFDYKIERIVTIRVEGLHHSEYGKVNPDNSLPPGTADDPVPFDDLVNEIQDAVQVNRTVPAPGRSDTDYTDVQIANESRRSSEYGDYYRADFELRVRGYETAP